MIFLVVKLTFSVFTLRPIRAQSERKSLFENLHEFFIPASYMIICGNFNSYDNELDKFGDNFSPCRALSDFKANFNLVDVWRKQHPRSCKFTWFNSDFSITSHADKLYVFPDLVQFIPSSSIRPCFFPITNLLILLLISQVSHLKAQPSENLINLC